MRKLAEWYYGRASIRKKLVISYLVLVLVPLAVLGGYAYRIARDNFLDQTRDTIAGNVASISYSLETSMQREDDNLRYLSYNSAFRERLERAGSDMIGLAMEMNNTVEPVFWYFITSDRNIKGIEIYSPYMDQPLGSFLKTTEECEGEPWYLDHQTNFQSLWTYEDGTLFITRTLLDAASAARPIGVMRLEVYANRFIEPIYQSNYRENGVLLLDPEGQVIGSRPLADETLEAEIRHLCLACPDAGLYETNDYLLQAEPAFESGWRLFYYVDKKEIAGDISAILRVTLLVVGVVLLVVLVLISVISRILSSRILKLKQSAEKVGRGEFDVTGEQGYTDEIGVVAGSFDVMSRKINEMIGEVYRMGLEKRATELKALQAMLNPHFLYNCLSSIKWKAIRADQESIAEITGLLAKFYRTTLNDGKQITTVKKELENVRAYLDIQSRMHEDSFDIEYELSDQGLELEMPNFVLQPIVENAIVHGVDCCPEGQRGLVRVEYREEASFLVFAIYNNGPRLAEAQMQKLPDTPGRGYGLYNIQERIHMYYDEACGVSSGVSADGLICFTLRIRREIADRLGFTNDNFADGRDQGGKVS